MASALSSCKNCSSRCDEVRRIDGDGDRDDDDDALLSASSPRGGGSLKVPEP